MLVSHDRRFIDNTVTHSWLFEGDGRITPYVGGYADLMNQRQQRQSQLASAAPVTKAAAEPVVKNETQTTAKKNRKLSYKLQLELDGLPARLEQLETEIDVLQAQVNQPDFFSLPLESTQATLDALQQAESNLEQAFARWEELEAMKNEE